VVSAAARELGVHEVTLLDYHDGELDAVDPAAAVSRIVAQLRCVRPEVVSTFSQDGAYGHPDHIAISQLTNAALVAAADAAYLPAAAPHRVAKLYYFAWPPQLWDLYQRVFKKLQMAMYEQLSTLRREQHELLWGDQYLYRVFSFVNGGRQIESDLFAGLQ